MNSVVVVEHLRVRCDGSEDVKMIGVYRSRDAAESAVARLHVQPGFRDFPNIVSYDDSDEQGFHVNEYELDLDHWTEGYVTL